MKQTFADYLAAVGLTGALVERAAHVLAFYERVYPSQIADIFVSEYVDKEGQRHYESLWAFAGDLMLEAKSFVTKDDFDAARLRGNVVYWRARVEHYDFENSESASRMTVDLNAREDVGGTLRASGENCDALRDIMVKYLAPNLTGSE